MCTMSAVMDWYNPYVPRPHDYTRPQPVPAQPYTWPQPGMPQKQIDELRELIDSFKKAVEAAGTFDRLTGQPDCVDPEKAELEKRVAELERKLDEIAQAAA